MLEVGLELDMEAVIEVAIEAGLDLLLAERES
jgi:hypothetical protein